MTRTDRILRIAAAVALLAALPSLGAPAAAQETPESDSAEAATMAAADDPASATAEDGDEAAASERFADVRRIEAVRVTGVEPTIDGRLDDEAWKEAAVATDFVQFKPDEGEAASERTVARILYGADALYVGVRAYDSQPDRIVGQLTRRDQNSYSDQIAVGIDSYFDRRTAFAFAVNPVGVKKDVYIFEDTQEDDSWDAVWDVETSVDSEGWIAEFRIPYSQLRFDGAQVQSWGLNILREIARYDEQSFWAPLSQTERAMVSRFGVLEGLEGIESPNRLEMEPYTMARVERSPGEAANPFYEATDYVGTVGADVKYGVTNNLTLNLTLNPDFGQVEADPAQVNLTAFETFFPEKRPFFLENQNIFDFGIGLGDGDGGNESLFYSRRIGRSPQGSADPRGGWKESPENTTILGAAKLSGKTASGWSIGALNAVTGQESAQIVTGDGLRTSEPVEPRTSYSMARVQKDFRDGWSAVGLVATATNRDASVADALELRRGAYAGGMDFRHRFGTDGDYQVRGSLLGSHVTGSAAAIERTQRSSARYFQRPDADHVDLDPSRTSLDGWAGNVEFGKWGGGYWRGAAMLQARSPGFEVNDMGFQRNADNLITAGFLGYHVSEPGEHFRRWNLNVNAWRAQTFGGERTSLAGNVNGSFTLHNLWGAHGGVLREAESFSTDLLRGGPAMRTTGGWNWWTGAYTDNRKAVQVRLNANGNVAPDRDSHRWRVGTNVRWRPSGSTTLSLGPFVQERVEDRQWVGGVDAGGERHYVFGRMKQTTAGLTGRFEMAFTPELSLQVYAQPFVSAGDFGEFKEVTDPRAERYEDRFRRLETAATDDGYEADLDGDGTVEDFDDPDFNVMQFRSNAVLRWQYRPGSTLFLVWSQSRDRFDDTGRFALGDDMGDLFGAEGSNVLMLKVSYWLSP